MSDEIRPALTPEEWEDCELAYPTVSLTTTRGGGVVVWNGQVGDNDQSVYIKNPKVRHALAALALHKQPFGFTWEDVHHLRLVAGQCEALRLGENHAHVLRDLADRIAALLPPEDANG